MSLYSSPCRGAERSDASRKRRTKEKARLPSVRFLCALVFDSLALHQGVQQLPGQCLGGGGSYEEGAGGLHAAADAAGRGEPAAPKTC